MKQTEKTRYQLFVRVRDFGAVNVDTFPASSPGGHAFAVVTKAIEAIKAHTTAKRLATTEGRKLKTERRSAVRTQMQEIVRTAKGVARELPGIDRHFRIPARRSDVVLVTAARSMLIAVDGMTERFVRLGLASSFVEDLRDAVDTLERSHDLHQSGRKALTEAQTGIGLAIARAFDAIRLLDIVVPNTLKSDPVRLAGWRRIRRLEGLRRVGPSGVKTDVPSALVAGVDVDPLEIDTQAPAESPAEEPSPGVAATSGALVAVGPPDEGLRRVS
jgi:hypothetical protein